MNPDWLELDVEFDGDETVTVYAHLLDRSMLAFHEVASAPVRLHGVWTFLYRLPYGEVTAHVPADSVTHFSVLRQAVPPRALFDRV